MNKRLGIVFGAFALLAAGTPLRAQNPAPLAPGAAAPTTSLLFNGRKISLKDALAGNRNLVVFYPGACTSCDAALQAIDKGVFRALDKMGIAVFAVSPDAPADQAKTARRLALPYTVFSDPGGAAAAAFHVAGTEAFLIDNDGTLRAVFGPGQTPLSGPNVIAAADALKPQRPAK